MNAQSQAELLENITVRFQLLFSLGSLQRQSLSPFQSQENLLASQYQQHTRNIQAAQMSGTLIVHLQMTQKEWKAWATLKEIASNAWWCLDVWICAWMLSLRVCFSHTALVVHSPLEGRLVSWGSWKCWALGCDPQSKGSFAYCTAWYARVTPIDRRKIKKRSNRDVFCISSDSLHAVVMRQLGLFYQ